MNGIPSLAALADAVRSAAADRARRSQLDAQLRVAEQLVATRREELGPLEQAQAAEEADVRRLEGLSPARLWATIRGDVDERRAIEQAEADAAAGATVAARARLDHAIVEVERVRRELDALGDVDGAYDRALDAYEAGLEVGGAPQATELSHLAENLGRVTAEQREIDEAAGALSDATAALDHALGRLESAGGWATYDTFFGGGMVADLIKHGRVDEATRAFVIVNRALERLSVELADLDLPAVRGAEISQGLAVFDVLFDNILSDWMVQSRIAEARDRARDLSAMLDSLAEELADRAARAAGVAAALTARREAILTEV
jgi:hypothetical protein